MGGDTSIIVVKKIEDGHDKWCDFSCEGIAKGGEIFGVYDIGDLLDEGSLEKYSL